jgi:hypothetical protein
MLSFGENTLTLNLAAIFWTKCDGGEVSEAIRTGIPLRIISRIMLSSLASFMHPVSISFPLRSRTANPVFMPASTPTIV